MGFTWRRPNVVLDGKHLAVAIVSVQWTADAIVVTAPSATWRLCSLAKSSASVTLWTAARQAPLSMEFPRQEYWRGLPFPFAGDPLDPGIEPLSPALESRFLTIEPLQSLHSVCVPFLSLLHFFFFFFYILLHSWNLGVLVEGVCVCFLILWCMSILIPRNRKEINSN